MSKWIKGTQENSRMTEGRKEKEKEKEMLKIGGLSYCSIFEYFVVLSFNVVTKKPFQSSSGYQKQREYGTSVFSNIKNEKWIEIDRGKFKLNIDI